MTTVYVITREDHEDDLRVCKKLDTVAKILVEEYEAEDCYFTTEEAKKVILEREKLGAYYLFFADEIDEKFVVDYPYNVRKIEVE